MAVSSICRYYVNYQLKRMVICTVLLLLFRSCRIKLGFPDSSVGKEPTCSARDPSSLPGSGRSAGEGIVYPLQYSWVSLAAQLVKKVKNPSTIRVRSLGWEDLLEKGNATHSSILV